MRSRRRADLTIGGQIALHNATAEASTDCPADLGAAWHFVLAPNDGSSAFVSITLDLGTEAVTFDGAELVPNAGQLDNVFVAVPAGHELSDLRVEGSSARYEGATPNQFNLSHVCTGTTTTTSTSTDDPRRPSTYDVDDVHVDDHDQALDHDHDPAVDHDHDQALDHHDGADVLHERRPLDRDERGAHHRCGRGPRRHRGGPGRRPRLGHPPGHRHRGAAAGRRRGLAIVLGGSALVVLARQREP